MNRTLKLLKHMWDSVIPLIEMEDGVVKALQPEDREKLKEISDVLSL